LKHAVYKSYTGLTPTVVERGIKMVSIKSCIYTRYININQFKVM